MVAIYLDDDVVKGYYAVAAVYDAPDNIHPRARLRQKIEDLVVQETARLRKQLDQELGNVTDESTI